LQREILRSMTNEHSVHKNILAANI